MLNDDQHEDALPDEFIRALRVAAEPTENVEATIVATLHARGMLENRRPRLLQPSVWLAAAAVIAAFIAGEQYGERRNRLPAPRIVNVTPQVAESNAVATAARKSDFILWF